MNGKNTALAQSVLNQHDYFKAVLNLKDPFNLLNRAGKLTFLSFLFLDILEAVGSGKENAELLISSRNGYDEETEP